MNRLLITTVVGLILQMGAVPESQAVVRALFDYDGSITEDRETGNMVTLYELHRVHQPALSAVDVPVESLPAVVLVSRVDYEKYKTQFSKGEGHTGGLVEVPLFAAETEFGDELTSFVPGHYFEPGPRTFARYRGDDFYDPAREMKSNHWLHDLATAMDLTKQGVRTHEGPGWGLMQHYLQNETMATAFSLITLRGYPEEQAEEVFRYKQKRGAIKALPIKNMGDKPYGYWTLGRPEFANRFGKVFYAKKARLYEELADQLLRTPAVELVLDPDGKEQAHMHTFVVVEDDPRFMQHIVELAQDLTRRGQHNIKWVLRHAGTRDELAVNEFPQRDVVVTSVGGFRPAKGAEIYIDPETVAVANSRIANQCARLLRRAKAKGGQK